MSLEDSWPFSKPLLPPVGGQELKLSSRTALPFSWQQRGSGTPRWQRLALACCYSCPPPTPPTPAYRASSPVVFLEGPFTATSVRVEAQEGGSPGGSGASSPLLACPPRLSGGFAFPMMWQGVGHLIPPICPCEYFCAMATLLGASRPHCDLSARAPSQAYSAEVALPKDPSRPLCPPSHPRAEPPQRPKK